MSTTAIYSSQGIKLVEQGVAIDPGLYDRLVRHQLEAPLDGSLQAHDSVSGASLRSAGQQLIATRPLLAALLGTPADHARLLDALEAVPLAPPVAFQLTLARDVHPVLFHYAVCTALLAGWLALGGGEASRYDTVMLTAAGLVQDLGMLHIDPALLNAEGALSAAQRRQLYSHPLVSALLLERHHGYPREMIRAVREHHELLDGSGYPAGLAGDRISPWGRALSLAQVMSALLRPGRNLPALRLSLLLRTNRHQFDPALCDQVLAALSAMDPQGPSGRPADADASTGTGAAAGPSAGTDTDVLAAVAAPVQRLRAMDELLACWPGELARCAGLAPARVRGMAPISQQCEQLRRLLADVGASADQLALLGSDAGGEAELMSELSLIAQEMAWQLHMLSRNVGHRWASGGTEPLPMALQDWLRSLHDGIAGLVPI